MEEYVQSAISAGLQEIIFLEHMEAGVCYFERTWLTEEDFDHYFSKGRQLQEKYQDKIRVLLGVEVGYSSSRKEELLERLSKRRWDRIGVSYHFMPHPTEPRHLNLLSKKKSNMTLASEIGCEYIFTHYLKTLIEAVNVLPGTVLCHLDAPLRHHPECVLDEGYVEKIRQLLKNVKQNSMALEINTSGLSKRGTPYPAPFIIREATQLGIPLVAGSDAHKPQDVAQGFSKLSSLPL